MIIKNEFKVGRKYKAFIQSPIYKTIDKYEFECIIICDNNILFKRNGHIIKATLFLDKYCDLDTVIYNQYASTIFKHTHSYYISALDYITNDNKNK